MRYCSIVGRSLGPALDQVLLDDDERRSRRAQVLLRSGIEERVALDVEGPGENIAAGIAEERRAVRNRRLFKKFGPEDCVVRREMDVGRLGAIGLLPRNVAEVAVLAAGCDMRIAEPLRLAQGLFRPGAGHQVVGGLILGEKIHGDHEELRGGAPLQKQDLVVVGNAAHLPAESHRLVVDVQKRLAAVGMFQDADPRVAQRQKRLAGLLQNGDRQDGRPGRKVVDPFGHGMFSRSGPAFGGLFAVASISRRR